MRERIRRAHENFEENFELGRGVIGDGGEDGDGGEGEDEDDGDE